MFRHGDYHGPGKLFYYWGPICYEGDFLRNNYHGKGKLWIFTKENEGIMISGEFANGEINGQAEEYKIYTSDQSEIAQKKYLKVFEGSYKKGVRDGLGSTYSTHSNQKLLEGPYHDGMKNGYFSE